MKEVCIGLALGAVVGMFLGSNCKACRDWMNDVKEFADEKMKKMSEKKCEEMNCAEDIQLNSCDCEMNQNFS